MAQLINAPSPREVVWTSNATAAINLVAQSWGRANLGPGDEVCRTAVALHRLRVAPACMPGAEA